MQLRPRKSYTALNEDDEPLSEATPQILDRQGAFEFLVSPGDVI
jgi:hypothetical protein